MHRSLVAAHLRLVALLGIGLSADLWLFSHADGPARRLMIGAAVFVCTFLLLLLSRIGKASESSASDHPQAV